MTYGTGTRSYNRSAEKREMDRKRAAATAAFGAAPHAVVEVPTGCPCCRRIKCIYGPGPAYASQDPAFRAWIMRKFGTYP